MPIRKSDPPRRPRWKAPSEVNLATMPNWVGFSQYHEPLPERNCCKDRDMSVFRLRIIKRPVNINVDLGPSPQWRFR